MTEEELEKEAEESFEQYKVTDEDYVVSPYSDDMGEKMLMYNDEYYAEETYLRFYTQGYFDGAEPREKEIKSLGERCLQLQKDKGELIDKVRELEKENAELKAKLKEHESIGNAQFWENVWSWKTKADQLTKAKEIIKTLLGFAEAFGYSPSMDKFIAEAEQFISEVEK